MLHLKKLFEGTISPLCEKNSNVIGLFKQKRKGKQKINNNLTKRVGYYLAIFHLIFFVVVPNSFLKHLREIFKCHIALKEGLFSKSFLCLQHPFSSKKN